MTKDKTEFYTVEQVADSLKVHWQTVLDFIRTGALEAIKLGKGYRISVSALNRFVEQRRINTATSLVSSEEFSSMPKQGKYTRYRSLLIVPANETENVIPSGSQSDSIIQNLVRDEFQIIEPRPEVDGLVADRVFEHINREVYFRLTSGGVIFLRESLSEPENEVYISYLLSSSFHLLKLAFLVYKNFGYGGEVFLKFRMVSIKDNVLKTGSFMRDLSMTDKAIRDKIEVEEGPLKITKDNISELAVKLVLKINRGFGNNRLGEDVLSKFLKNIIEGKE